MWHKKKNLLLTINLRWTQEWHISTLRKLIINWSKMIKSILMRWSERKINRQILGLILIRQKLFSVLRSNYSNSNSRKTDLMTNRTTIERIKIKLIEGQALMDWGNNQWKRQKFTKIEWVTEWEFWTEELQKVKALGAHFLNYQPLKLKKPQVNAKLGLYSNKTSDC